MKAHSETHFENEYMFLEKSKVINPFYTLITGTVLTSMTIANLWKAKKWFPLMTIGANTPLFTPMKMVKPI